VVHKGTQWPCYNPGRIYSWFNWSFDYPTELKWQVDNWYGLHATGAPTAGRMTPWYPGFPDRFFYYQDLICALDLPFQLRIEFLMPDGLVEVNARCRILISGVDQVFMPAPLNLWAYETFPVGLGFTNYPGDIGANAVHPVEGSSAYFGTALWLAPATWRDVPKPMRSTPY
jgi:hypothetical protein